MRVAREAICTSSVRLVRVRISAAIDNEYASRCPEFLPLDKLHEGWCVLTVGEAREVLADAQFNSDKTAVDVGPNGMSLGVFNAYRALAKQVAGALDGIPRDEGCS